MPVIRLLFLLATAVLANENSCKVDFSSWPKFLVVDCPKEAPGRLLFVVSPSTEQWNAMKILDTAVVKDTAR